MHFIPTHHHHHRFAPLTGEWMQVSQTTKRVRWVKTAASSPCLAYTDLTTKRPREPIKTSSPSTSYYQIVLTSLFSALQSFGDKALLHHGIC